MYRLIEAHWITMTEAKHEMTLLELAMAEEALGCWEEARAIADFKPAPG